MPFVWHFKEAPQRCLLRGEWPLLVDLHTRSHAQLYSSVAERDWFEAALPGRIVHERAAVLDGDLPKRDWLEGERAPRLSARTNEAHTVLVGRPYGFAPALAGELARRRVHLHVYGVGPEGAWAAWLRDAAALAGRRLHLHPSVEPEHWVGELSRYDAGWLHPVAATNGGDLRRATWDDLNLPARMPTLVAAGLPLLVPASPGSVFAARDLAAELGVGLLFEDVDDVAAQLADGPALDALRARAWEVRHELTFDHHADRLVALLREVSGARPREAG